MADVTSAAQGPLTAERYIAALYPRFAWEAMVRLGDASTAGRLVERVLHRAWRERERFAASEALLRHAAESAEAAIAREEARRLSVTRFDPEDGVSALPGDLSPLAMNSVVERLRTGRAPAPTPATGAPVVAPAAPAPASAPAAPAPAPTPAAPPRASAPAAAAPSAATGTHRAATAEPPRRTLRSASYIAKPPARRIPPRILAAIGGGVLVVATLAWRLSAGPSGIEAARHAAADSTAATWATGRGERRDSTVAAGLVVSLGPSSSVRLPAALAEGIRGIAAQGFVAIDAAADSAHPVVVRAAGQQLEWTGGRVSVITTGDTVMVFAESADVTHRATTATRIASGQSVRIVPSGSVEGLDRTIAAQRFGWRSGRLVTGPVTVRELRPIVGTWFGIDVASDLADTVALDVPLDSASALPVALADGGRLQATLEGSKLTIAKPAPRPVRRRPAPVEAEIELPVLRKLPGVP